jgi:hypothetical protein
MHAAIGVTVLLIATYLVAHYSIRFPASCLAFSTALVLRVGAVTLHTLGYALPYSDADALNFVAAGTALSLDGFESALGRVAPGALFYPSLLGLLFALAGPGEFVAQAVNVAFGVWAVVLVHKLAVEMGGTAKQVSRVTLLAAVFPSLVIFSSVPLREAPIVSFLLLGTLYLVRWRYTSRITALILAGGSFGVATLFHSGCVAALLALLVFVFVRVWSAAFSGTALSSLRALVGLVLIVGAGAIAVVSGLQLGKTAIIEEGIAQAQETKARDRAAYLENMQASDPRDLLWQGPIRVVYFLTTPYPWWVTSLRDVAGLVDALIFLVLALAGLRGAIGARVRTPAWWTLFVVFWSCVLIFSIATSNYGTALRHRAKFAPLLICLALMTPPRRLTFRLPEHRPPAQPGEVGMRHESF